MLTKDTAKDFGDWLRTQRMLRRLTVEEAKDRAGISRDIWMSLEAGGRMQNGEWRLPNPRPQTLLGIADALELSLEELFRRTGMDMDSRLLTAVTPSEPKALEEFQQALLAAIKVLTDRVGEVEARLSGIAASDRTEAARPSTPARRAVRREPATHRRIRGS